MGASMAVEGATDKYVFEAYVERFLAPTLSEGQVVVMDKLGAHRTRKARELVEGWGAQLRLLPSYSPGLDPIEEAFSKVEGLLLRRALGRARARHCSRRSRRRCRPLRPKTQRGGSPTAPTGRRLKTCADRCKRSVGYRASSRGSAWMSGVTHPYYPARWMWTIRCLSDVPRTAFFQDLTPLL